MKYRKKPVVVDAIQYTGTNLKEVLEFTGKHPKWHEWFVDFDGYQEYVRQDRNVFKLITLEGTMEAHPGDWIIRGIMGEHYPCKDEIFRKTYDLDIDSPVLMPAQITEELQEAFFRAKDVLFPTQRDMAQSEGHGWKSLPAVVWEYWYSLLRKE